MDNEAVISEVPVKKEKVFYDEISIARGIGIVLVVLGHAFPDASSGIATTAASYIWSFIYSFHMALFIFISGFLGSKCVDLSEWNSWKTFIWKRCKRLLIPYVCMTIVYLPLKIVMAKYANNTYDISNIWQVLFGVSPNYELWTLYTLFLLAAYSAVFVNRKNIVIHLVVWFFVMVAAYIAFDTNGLLYENAAGIYYFLQYGFFYLLGIYVCINYDKVRAIFNNRRGGVTLLLVSLVILVGAFVLDKFLYNKFSLSIAPIKIITSMAGTSLVLIISYYLSKVRGMKLLKSLGGYCMDVYILSAFMQPVLRIVFYNVLGMEYWTFTILSAILTIVLSVVISKYIVRKIPYVRTAVLGMD